MKKTPVLPAQFSHKSKADMSWTSNFQISFLPKPKRSLSKWKLAVAGLFFALLCSSGKTFGYSEMNKTVSGKYYWLLAYDIKNTSNVTTHHDIELVESKTVNTEQFLSETFDVKKTYQLGNELSIGLKVGPADLKGHINTRVHSDIANNLLEQSKDNKSLHFKKAITHKVKVEPNGSATGWQLVYVGPGVEYETGVISTTPRDDVIVEMQYTLKQRVLGVRELLDALLTIVPKHDNKKEWQRIRDSIVAHSHQSSTYRFKELVMLLTEIEPYHHNKEVWDAVRRTAIEIVSDFENTPTQELFIKLLTQLSILTPTKNNTLEWRAIRVKCKALLDGLKVV